MRGIASGWAIGFFRRRGAAEGIIYGGRFSGAAGAGHYFEAFRDDLEAALSRSDRAKGGRPPYDAVLMFKIPVLQTL